ncbi:MAG: carbohydrate ABC transporter permease [Ruminococcus sp.]|jgi:multiple sugar transport system permease protein|nr:carbohydrate ABC transporter permease [Ruminococcus sp.]
MSRPALEYDLATKQDLVLLNIRRTFCYIVLGILALLALLPFLFLLSQTTRANHQIIQGFSLLPSTYFDENFVSVLNSTYIRIFRGMFNSFVVATTTTAISVYFSAFTAYGIHVYDFKGNKQIYTTILMIMMVPTQVSALGFLDMVDNWGFINTFWPLIVPAIAAPTVMFFMKQYMEASLPLEIIEAARIDGCNEFITFNTIVLPILKPAFAVQAIFAFVANWNNFFLPNLILEKPHMYTLPIMMMQLRNSDFSNQDQGQQFMFIALSILPVIIVYLILSKFIIRGVTLGAVKG